MRLSRSVRSSANCISLLRALRLARDSSHREKRWPNPFRLSIRPAMIDGREDKPTMNSIHLLLACLLGFPSGEDSRPLRLDINRDTWVSEVGREADGNNGAAPRLKLKSIQEMSLVDIDPAPLRGHVVQSGDAACQGRGRSTAAAHHRQHPRRGMVRGDRHQLRPPARRGHVPPSPLARPAPGRVPGPAATSATWSWATGDPSGGMPTHPRPTRTAGRPFPCVRR